MKDRYKEAFKIDDYEGTKFAFLTILEKLLSPIPPDGNIKVQMSVKWEGENVRQGDDGV